MNKRSICGIIKEVEKGTKKALQKVGAQAVLLGKRRSLALFSIANFTTKDAKGQRYMKAKSEKSKLKDKRGVPSLDEYEAWITARESKTTATSCALFDPIQERTVNCLSQAEVKVFWIIRFLTSNGIYEQFPLDKTLVDQICEDHGFRKYSKILSTDFLVEAPDGSIKAFSVKDNIGFFDKDKPKYIEKCVRQKVDEEYWAKHDIEQKIVFADDIDVKLVSNIKLIMKYYKDIWITDAASLLMHLMAHRVVRMPLDKGFLPIKTIAGQLPVEEMYEAYKRQEDDPNFSGWDFDLVGGNPIPHFES